jgi:hypothetical protein
MKDRHAFNPVTEGTISIGILAMNVCSDAAAYSNQRISRQHRQAKASLRGPPYQTLQAAARLHANGAAPLIKFEETIESRHFLNYDTVAETCCRVSQAGAPGDTHAAPEVGLKMTVSVRPLMSGYKRHRAIEGYEARAS